VADAHAGNRFPGARRPGRRFLLSAGVLAGWPGAVSAPRSPEGTRRRDAAGPAAGTAALQSFREVVRGIL